MGIHLDWQVESDTGHQAVEEDAQVIVAQKKRRRRWLLALIAALVVVGVASSIAWYRAKIVRDEKLRVLLATVDAEAEALRLGDEDKFMKLQGPDEKWRDEQRDMFAQMQSFGVSIDVTGQILNQHVTDREAEITVEIKIGGMPTQAVWLYQYTEKGWKHVDTQQEPWQETIVERPPFTYEYNTAHQPLIDQLDTVLREWWAVSQAELGLNRPMPLTIIIDPEVNFVRWHPDDRAVLAIPQKMLVAADLSERDDPLRIELAQRVSSRWSIYYGDEKDIRITNYDFQTEIALWLHDRYETDHDQSSRPSIFSRLATYLGPDVFSQFLQRWEASNDGTASLEALILPDSPATYNGLPAEAYLEDFLNAYSALNGDRASASIFGYLQDIFVTFDYTSGSVFMADMYVSGAQTGTFEIEDMELFQEVLWVRATFRYNSNYWWPDREPNIIDRTALIPFRKDGETWKLTSLSNDDWGATLTETGDDVTFHYPELDQAMYQGMVPYIQSVYEQAADQLGIEAVLPIEIMVRTNFMFIENQWDVIDPQVYPDRMQCCSDYTQMDQETARRSVGVALYYDLFSYAAGSPRSSGRSPVGLEDALITWGQRQLGLGYDYQTTVPQQAYPEVQVPTTFEDIWATNLDFTTETSEYRYSLIQRGLDVLVELVMDTYGEDVFRPLVITIRSTPSISEWLRVSLLIDEAELLDLEAKWRERYHAEVREIYGDEAFATD